MSAAATPIVKLCPLRTETRVLTAMLATLLLGAPGCLARSYYSNVAETPSVAYVTAPTDPESEERTPEAREPSRPDEERSYRPARAKAETERLVVKPAPPAKPKKADEEPMRKRVKK
jgi:hypothetical protein